MVISAEIVYYHSDPMFVTIFDSLQDDNRPIFNIALAVTYVYLQKYNSYNTILFMINYQSYYN